MTRDRAHSLINASIDMRRRINSTQEEIHTWANALMLSIGIEPLHALITARYRTMMYRRRIQLLALSRIQYAIDNELVAMQLERQ